VKTVRKGKQHSFSSPLSTSEGLIQHTRILPHFESNLAQSSGFSGPSCLAQQLGGWVHLMEVGRRGRATPFVTRAGLVSARKSTGVDDEAESAGAAEVASSKERGPVLGEGLRRCPRDRGFSKDITSPFFTSKTYLLLIFKIGSSCRFPHKAC
jgi:hypothetical protein